MSITGSRIRDRRKQIGKSADEVATCIGVSRSTIFRYENGGIDKVPSNILEPLALALCTTEEYLMGWTDDPINYDDGDIIANLSPTILDYFDGDVKKTLEFHEAVDRGVLGPPPETATMGFNMTGNLSVDGFESERVISFPVIGNIAAGYDGQAVEIPSEDVELIPLSLLGGRDSKDYFVLRVTGDSMYPKFLDGDRVLVLRCTSVDSGSIAVILYNGYDATIKRVNYVYGEDWLDLIPINPEYQTKRIEGTELDQCRVLGKVVKLMRDVD